MAESDQKEIHLFSDELRDIEGRLVLKTLPLEETARLKLRRLWLQKVLSLGEEARGFKT